MFRYYGYFRHFLSERIFACPDVPEITDLTGKYTNDITILINLFTLFTDNFKSYLIKILFLKKKEFDVK